MSNLIEVSIIRNTRIFFEGDTGYIRKSYGRANDSSYIVLTSCRLACITHHRCYHCPMLKLDCGEWMNGFKYEIKT